MVVLHSDDEENQLWKYHKFKALMVSAGHTHVLFPNRSIPNTEYIQYDKGLVIIPRSHCYTMECS